MNNDSSINMNLPAPHAGQLEVLKSNSRFKVICAGRRWGKSNLSLSKCIIELVSTKTHRGKIVPSQVAYVTPTYALGKDFFQDVLRYLPKAIIKSANKSDLTIELIDSVGGGGVMRFISGKEMDNHFRGKRFHFVVVDECAQIPNFAESMKALRNTLTDYKGKCWFISTPRGFDHFYNLYNKGLNKLDDYASFHFTTYDNPYIDTAEVDAIKAEVTEAEFNQENLAIPSENACAFVPSKFIQENTVEELSDEPTVIFGIDVAGTHDYTVITGLSASGKMTYFDRFRNGWEAVKTAIKKLPENTFKVMDSTGAGKPIFEELSLTLNNFHDYHFDKQSKSVLIRKLALAIEKGELKFNKATATELSTYEYKYNYTTGHVSYNAILGAHDDTVIALALCNFYKDQFISQSFEDRFYVGG